MKRFVAAIALVFVAGLAFAATDAEIQEKVQDIIMERHPTETPEWWRALGPEAPRVLIGMYEKSTHIYHRVRLLQGLGWFDTPEAAEFLKAQASSTTEDSIRTTAIRSVAHSQGMKEAEFLSKFLEHDDVHTRFAAADALRRLKDPRADEIVARYLKTEKTPWVAGKLEGKLPEPRGKFTSVASSEDRLSPDFNGEWRGFWLLPPKLSEPGMTSEAATVRLKLDGPNAVKGELVLVRKGKPRTYWFDKATGKGLKLSGSLIDVPVPAPSPRPLAPSPEELVFEAELSQQAGHYLIDLRSKRIGATLVVRRNPVK
ncbi:MAG: HEAT repeat domain-containing protein [Oligoflexia bacterium]|nr:HEAT repeat domain-containing protein [Oligoflexia bacterium]